MSCVNNIQPPESALCRSVFGSDYSFESSWVCQFCTNGFGDFLPFFLTDLLTLCQVEWGVLVNSNLQVFPQINYISMGFKAGLWLGPSRTFIFLFWSHSSVALAVCLESLSCWDVNLCRIQRSFAFWSRFFSRISLYLAPFIGPSILTNLPVPATEKHPHNMLLTPPCFTVRMVLDGWWDVLSFCQT